MEEIFTYNGERFCLSLPYRKPALPFKAEYIESEENGFIGYKIDKDGFIWILIDRVVDGKDYGPCYYDGCLRECITYIVIHCGFYHYLTIKFLFQDHLNGKEEYYNRFLGQYD